MPCDLPIEDVGDNLLIGHAPNPAWRDAVFFETPKQMFERTGKWLAKDELDYFSAVLVKIHEPEKTYVPANQLFNQLGPERYIETMRKLGLSEGTFSSLNAEMRYGQRISGPCGDFPGPSGIHHPDILVHDQSGKFFAFWPELLGISSLATVNETFGAEKVWLKSIDGVYMTPAGCNSRLPEGAEGAFGKLVGRPHIIEDNDVLRPLTRTSNFKAVTEANFDRPLADHNGEQSYIVDVPNRSERDGQTQPYMRGLEPRSRDSIGR
ncbi:hypothetical protein AJ87_11515 [Rhizobium yanglingense]|nr:hypothetical protein AJ87_11515 [Rhizobium yanglingense]